jgi:ATP-dependent Clp protease protease subunit
MTRQQENGPLEIALVGELSDKEADLTDKLLEVPPGGECYLYFDSPGGSAYVALALTSLIVLRGLKATAIVTGEVSSAALWPFSACKRRLVTQLSVGLFHPMKWQSEENVGIAEAAEWARHFKELEGAMDELLASMLGMPIDRLKKWLYPGKYVSGPMMAEAGIAELVPLAMLSDFAPKKRK